MTLWKQVLPTYRDVLFADPIIICIYCIKKRQLQLRKSWPIRQQLTHTKEACGVKRQENI